jgi:hypothetical protein
MNSNRKSKESSKSASKKLLDEEEEKGTKQEELDLQIKFAAPSKGVGQPDKKRKRMDFPMVFDQSYLAKRLKTNEHETEDLSPDDFRFFKMSLFLESILVNSYGEAVKPL